MSNYPLRHRVLLGVALLHLALVALGASYVSSGWAGRAGPALGYYSELSGAGYSYGFFAPGVFSQLRAVFEITDSSGKVRQVPLATGASNEADLRVGNIIDQFSGDHDDPVAYQRSLSSSLAGTIFGRFPETKTVNVLLERFNPISMSEYREGRRADWETIYQAKYAIANHGSGK